MLDLNLTDCSGAPISGSVGLYLNGNFLNFVSVNNGSANISNIQTGTYTFYAVSGSLAGNDSITITSATVFPLSKTISLCDTLQTAINNFNATISTPVTGVVNVSLNVTAARFQLINGIKNVILTYIDPVSLDSGQIFIKTPGYAPGTYMWNNFDSNVSGVIINSGIYTTISTNPNIGSGYTNFISTPPIGSNIEGSFSGDMQIGTNGISVIGLVNANFNVIRTH
jgi:hypothetical protein